MVATITRRKSEPHEQMLSSVLVWHRPSFLQPTSTLVWTTALGVRWIQDCREKHSVKTFIEWKNILRVSKLAARDSMKIFDNICSERSRFGSPPSSSCCFFIESFDGSLLFLECSSVEQCNVWFNFCQDKVNSMPVHETNDENLPPAKYSAGNGMRLFFNQGKSIHSQSLVTGILFVCMVAITTIIV